MNDSTLRSVESAEPRVKVDMLARLETVLDHPVEKVWPYILHWNLWIDQNDYLEHRVGGVADTEGEIKRITHFDETGRVDSVFFVRVTKIVPHQLLIYKILSPQFTYDAGTGACTEEPMTGYEALDLSMEKGRTVLRVYIYAESQPAGVTEEQAARISKEYTVSTDKVWQEKYFLKLKDLLSKT